MTISAQEHIGLQPLLKALAKMVQLTKVRQPVPTEETGLPVLRLAGEDTTWKVTKVDDRFVVTGARIERFAQRTDFNNPEGVNRLRDIMRKMGILHELERQAINSGQVISIAGHTFSY